MKLGLFLIAIALILCGLIRLGNQHDRQQENKLKAEVDKITQQQKEYKKNCEKHGGVYVPITEGLQLHMYCMRKDLFVSDEK